MIREMTPAERDDDALTLTAPNLTWTRAGLLLLSFAAEHATATSPAVTAFWKAIRRKGQELVQAGGPEALAFIRDQAPARAEHRETILAEAWSGLPGWRR